MSIICDKCVYYSNCDYEDENDDDNCDYFKIKSQEELLENKEEGEVE